MHSTDDIMKIFQEKIAAFDAEHAEKHREMYDMPPQERSKYKRQQAEEALETGPVEFMQGKYHTKAQFADLGPKWVEGIANLILSDPEKMFESGLYRNKTFAKFLDNTDKGKKNFVLAAARAIIRSNPVDALTKYKFYDIKLLNPLSWGLYQMLKRANIDLNNSMVKNDMRALAKVIALTYPEKFLTTEELVNNPENKTLIPAAKRRMAK